MTDNYRYLSSNNKDDFERLRLDLPIIMAFAGWSNQVLATLLGVTTATINHIKRQPYYMSTMNYLAICKLIDDEITLNGNQALQEAINILNNVGGYTMDRTELVGECLITKRQIGKKRGVTAVKEALREWMLNDEDCA